jgi:hypothetical protein
MVRSSDELPHRTTAVARAAPCGRSGTRHVGPSPSRTWRVTCSVVSEGDVLERAFEHCKDVDDESGKQIES